MSARAPQAIEDLWAAIHKAVPAAVLSGIVGDSAHSFGYHLARRDLPASDYSVQLPKDKLGPSDAASALDVTLNATLMKALTWRLLTAARAHDPRLAAVREFAGTLNGSQVVAWDLSTGAYSYGWDSSHLWHIHLSFYREYADDTAALAPVADVIAGKPLPAPKPKPKPANVPAFPLPSGQYFGPTSGPTISHGGFYGWERPYITRIQQRLQALGYAPRIAGWADGLYGPHTAAAVTKWQRAKWARYTTRYGEVWADDWRRLFS